MNKTKKDDREMRQLVLEHHDGSIAKLLHMLVKCI